MILMMFPVVRDVTDRDIKLVHGHPKRQPWWGGGDKKSEQQPREVRRTGGCYFRLSPVNSTTPGLISA